MADPPPPSTTASWSIDDDDNNDSDNATISTTADDASTHELPSTRSSHASPNPTHETSQTHEALMIDDNDDDDDDEQVEPTTFASSSTFVIDDAPDEESGSDRASLIQHASTADDAKATTNSTTTTASSSSSNASPHFLFSPYSTLSSNTANQHYDNQSHDSSISQPLAGTTYTLASFTNNSTTDQVALDSDFGTLELEGTTDDAQPPIDVEIAIAKPRAVVLRTIIIGCFSLFLWACAFSIQALTVQSFLKHV
jgi:hypothetical protein